jgi:hypothetical protein
MHRRDLSAALLATTAGAAALLSRRAEAQSACTIAPSSGPTYAVIPAETAAGITPVNYCYPPFCVDRYAANTTPGSTPMDAAFNLAVKAAYFNVTATGKSGGTVTWGQTGPYLLTAPINCTWAPIHDAPGIVMRNIASCDWGVTTTATGGATVILGHSSIGFDCTGNASIQFIDLCLTTNTATPECAILFARNSHSGSLLNRVIRPRILGIFTVSAIYNYGSENDQITDGFIENYCTSPCRVITFTSNNLNNLSPFFATDPAGNTGVSFPTKKSQSCTGHDLTNMSLGNFSASLGSDVIGLDGVAGYHQSGGWMYATGCRSYWYNDQTNASGSTNMGVSNDIQMRDIRCEHQTNPPLYGFCYGPAGSAAPSISVGLVISSCHFETANAAVTTLDQYTTIDEMLYEAITEDATGGIQLYNAGAGIGGNVTRSVINSDTIVSVPGTLSNSIIIGKPSNWTIGMNGTALVPHSNNFQSVCGGVAGKVSFGGTATASVAIPTFAQLSAGSNVNYAVAFSVVGATNTAGNCWVSAQSATGFTISASAANSMTVGWTVTMY